MHIRTPRRYRSRRSRLISTRTVLMLIMTGLLVGTGAFVLQNATTLQPIAYEIIGTAVVKVQDQAQTVVAPTATATKDPRNDLINADPLWKQGSVSQALSLYIPALPSLPNDVEVHYRVALGMIIQGSLKDAVDYADMTVNANPYSSDAWALRGWALDWLGGRTGDAIASLLQAKDLDANNPRVWAYLAEAYASAGQGNRAFDTADQAVTKFPDSPEVFRSRGYLSWNLYGDLDSALTDYTTAYDLAMQSNPALAGLYAVDIAQIQIGKDNTDGAQSILQQVLDVNPDNTQALLAMGTLQFTRRGDLAQASSFLQRCVDIAPESIDCNYQLGRVQFRTDNQTVAAAESFARAIELGSTSARHYWWAANSQIALGNCSRALDYMETGYDLAKDASNTELIQAFEDIMPKCGATFGPAVIPQATAEATTEPDA